MYTNAGTSDNPVSGIQARTLASELLQATKGKGKAESPDEDDVPFSRRKVQLLAQQIAALRSRLDYHSKACDITACECNTRLVLVQDQTVT